MAAVVTEWVINAVVTVWNWLVSNAPAPDVPSWFGSASAATTAIGNYMGWLDPWVPLWLLYTGIIAVTVSWFMGNAIRVARILASYFTFGGGAV